MKQLTTEQQSYIQTKLDGWNDCYMLLHRLLTETTEAPGVPPQMREIFAGFVDSMYRDQVRMATDYTKKQIEELTAPMN